MNTPGEQDARYWGLTRLQTAHHHARLAGYYAAQARQRAALAGRYARASTRAFHVLLFGVAVVLVAMVVDALSVLL